MTHNNQPVKIGLAVALAVFVYNWIWFITNKASFLFDIGTNQTFLLIRFFEVFTVVTLASWGVLSFTKGTLLRIVLITSLVAAIELPPLSALPMQDVVKGLFYFTTISIAVYVFARADFKEAKYPLQKAKK